LHEAYEALVPHFKEALSELQSGSTNKAELILSALMEVGE
jgi:hypothetical protein